MFYFKNFCDSCLFEVHSKVTLREFWFEIKRKFPKISEMALNIFLPVFLYHIFIKSFVLNIYVYKIKISVNVENIEDAVDATVSNI